MTHGMRICCSTKVTHGHYSNNSEHLLNEGNDNRRFTAHYSCLFNFSSPWLHCYLWLIVFVASEINQSHLEKICLHMCLINPFSLCLITLLPFLHWSDGFQKIINGKHLWNRSHLIISVKAHFSPRNRSYDVFLDNSIDIYFMKMKTATVIFRNFCEQL